MTDVITVCLIAIASIFTVMMLLYWIIDGRIDYVISPIIDAIFKFIEEASKNGKEVLDMLIKVAKIAEGNEDDEEEQEVITADIDRPLTFEELVNALDVISKPTEISDVPLTVDPDDYPVR